MADVVALETAIERERERFNVPGLAVAVVHDGKVLLARGFGQRDVDAGLPVTEQTLFPIGSSTKSFTASVLASLVDEGRLDWDAPVREYLPGFRMFDPVATEHLSTRDMLSHRSGLPRHDFAWIENNDITRAEIARRLRYLPPNKTFREKWQYNNLLYITAGHLAEALLDCSWEDAVRLRLLAPLGMTNTNFSVRDAKQSSDHAIPYLDKDGEHRAVPHRGLDLAGPCGSMNSCIADMARWALVNASAGEVDGRVVLSPAAVRELHSPAMVLAGNEMSNVADQYPEARLHGYGLGWFVENYRGNTIVHHGGNIDGFSSMVSALPAERIGVVVLTNLSGTHARDVLPYVVYDMLLGLEPLPWGSRLRAAEEAMRAGMKEARSAVEAKAQAAPPSHEPAEYAGDYWHPGYGMFRVLLEDGVLVPRYNDFDEFVLRHRHYDVWDLVLEAFDATIPLSFALDFDGDVASLSVPFESTLPPIVFARQPDPALADPKVLARYTGRFVMDPMVLDVELDPAGTLVASTMGEHFELLPHRDRRFKVKDQPSLTLEFTVENGTATSVLLDPVGIFTRSPAEA